MEVEKIIKTIYRCPHCEFETENEKLAFRHLRGHQEVTLELTRAELHRLQEIIRYVNFHAESFFADSTGKMLVEKVRRKK